MLTDDLVEARLREHFKESLEPSERLVARVLRRQRRHRARQAAGVAFPLVLAIALGTVLATDTSRSHTAPGSSRAAVVLRLASYDFALPQSYRLTASAEASCGAITLGVPSAARTSASSVITVTPRPTTTVSSAASSAGGCVSMVLTSAFTPTATTPLPYLRHGTAAQNEPVRVGPYTGWIATQGALIRWLARQGLVTGGRPGPDLQLSVEIPQGGGSFRLLDVGSRGMSEATLVRIVGEGLTP